MNLDLKLHGGWKTKDGENHYLFLPADTDTNEGRLIITSVSKNSANDVSYTVLSKKEFKIGSSVYVIREIDSNHLTFYCNEVEFDLVRV